MKRKISVFISMFFLALTMVLAGSMTASAEEAPALDYDKSVAEYVAMGAVRSINSVDYADELKYIDSQYLKDTYGDEYKEIIEIYESRAKLQEEIGNFQEFTGETEYSEDPDNGIVTVTLTARYDNGLISFEVPMTSTEYMVTSETDIKMSEAEAEGETKPMGQAMGEAGLNTIMGVTIVFAMLIVISFVISLFKFINRPEKKKEAPAPVRAPEPAAAPREELVDATDDCEIAAVITAAIMASMEEAGEEVPADGLVVRSIKKRNAKRWQNA